MKTKGAARSEKRRCKSLDELLVAIEKRVKPSLAWALC